MKRALAVLILAGVPLCAQTKLRFHAAASSITSYSSMNTGLGAGTVNSVTYTTSGGTDIQATAADHNTALAWITAPFLSAVTIAQTVTFNVYGGENSNANNAAFRGRLYKYSGGSEGAAFAVCEMATELSTTLTTARNFTCTPTSTSFAAGDRLVAKLFIENCATSGCPTGTMGTGSPGVTAHYDGTTDAADGSSWVQTTETLSLGYSAAPQDLVSAADVASRAIGRVATVATPLAMLWNNAPMIWNNAPMNWSAAVSTPAESLPVRDVPSTLTGTYQHLQVSSAEALPVSQSAGGLAAHVAAVADASRPLDASQGLAGRLVATAERLGILEAGSRQAGLHLAVADVLFLRDLAENIRNASYLVTWNSINATWNGILTSWGAPAGTSYTRIVSEQIVIAEAGAGAGAHFAMAADRSTAADLVARSVGLHATVSDVLQAADLASRLSALHAAVSDALQSADLVARSAGLHVTVAEGVPVNAPGRLQIAVAMAVSENLPGYGVAASDSATGSAVHGQNVSEVRMVSDAASGSAGHLAAVSERLRLLESSGGIRNLARLITWNGISATWNGSLLYWGAASGGGTAYTRVVSESLLLVESATGVKNAGGTAYTRVVSEVLTIREKSPQMAYALNTPENGLAYGYQLYEYAVGVKNGSGGSHYTQLVSETVGLQEVGSGSGVHLAAVWEAVVLAESPSRVGAHFAGVRDAFSLSEALGFAKGQGRLVSDALLMSDQAGIHGAHFAAPAELVAAFDVPRPLAAHFAASIEAFSLSEFGAGLKNSGVQHFTQLVSDLVSFAESGIGRAAHRASPVELLPVWESRVPYAAHFGMTVEGVRVSEVGVSRVGRQASPVEMLILYDYATGGFRVVFRKRGVIIN